jgi:2-methylcitrate dehydratase
MKESDVHASPLQSVVSASTPLAPADLATHLAAYADALQYEDLDERTIEAVKCHFADALGCALSAAGEGPVQIARRVALATGKGDATLIGTRDKTSAEMASFVNGAAIRHYDFNDIYAAKEIGHPSDNISACLAVAETQGATGRDLILSIALQYEIVCRLIDAAAISTRGWDHPCLSLPAVALAAGKMMKLSQAKLVEAVNLAVAPNMALNQTRVQALSNWKGMADGNAARNAIFATLLAREGVTGPSPVFEGNWGFFKQISQPFTMDTAQFGGRSRPFKIHDCTVKFYPALGMAQTAVPAALDVAGQVEDLKRIAQVEIHTTEVGYTTSGKDPQKWTPKNSETADHSLPYIVSKAMFDGDIDHDSYNEASLRDPVLLAFMQKVRVTVDPELTKLYPKYYPTRVTATLDDGRVFSKQIDDTPGFPTSPMTRADFELKFRKNVRSCLTAEQTDKALNLIWNLEKQDDFSELFATITIRNHG